MSENARVLMASDRSLQRLEPVFLLASAISVDGNMDLPAVQGGRPDDHLRVEIRPDESGGFVQRCCSIHSTAGGGPAAAHVRGRFVPLDMVFLAECLSWVFGHLTPPLFHLAEASPGHPPELHQMGESADGARRRLLHAAFSAYLLAYEDRLV